MLLELHRIYYDTGTNGMLLHQDAVVCFTIELPWMDNMVRLSCIPEGIYVLGKRHSKKFDWHMEVRDVAERSLILIHPANDALDELKGCIAPVSEITGIGLGVESRKAFDKLRDLVYKTIDQGESVRLKILRKELT